MCVDVARTNRAWVAGAAAGTAERWCAAPANGVKTAASAAAADTETLLCTVARADGYVGGVGGHGTFVLGSRSVPNIFPDRSIVGRGYDRIATG